MKKNIVRAAVLRVAGTNCDQETMRALALAGGRPVLCSLREVMGTRDPFRDFSVIVVPGGFSYGDDIAAGKVMANEMRFKLKDELVEFVRSGRLVIGICNGFQVLVKSGLLPACRGNLDERQEATLTFNNSAKFEDRSVHLKMNKNSCCVFTRGLPERLFLPVAHGEGKFITRNRAVLNELVANGQVVFQYSERERPRVARDYPENPNGSVLGIAGICNRQGNVLGMMPHPERYLSRYHHPRWTRLKLEKKRGAEVLGLRFYEAAIEYASRKLRV